MAEIKIEKKKSVWPWVLLGLGILALLLYFFVFNNKKEEGEAPATALIDVHENNSTVASYVAFINSDTNKMSLDHKFTNEALLMLTDATNAMADAVGFSVKADLEKAKELANKITVDPFETSHTYGAIVSVFYIPAPR